jgi:tryptophan synthase alpha subunit
VVGSAIVKELNEKGVEAALGLVKALAKAVHK